ncbi:MAG: response regulator [Candidatus Wildermuthbacteria bacterium]|nr:response regulator [Candidatus Wildermuthbacteria bacterium]
MAKILLVEDDAMLIDIYTTKLREANFEVEVAQDGQEALRVVAEKNPDIMLLDIVLPHMDGWEVLEQLKTNRPANLKIFVFSNLSQKDEIERGAGLGVDKYLIKAHYTPSQVIEEIKKTIG